MQAEERKMTAEASFEQFLRVLRHNITDAALNFCSTQNNAQGLKPRNFPNILQLLDELNSEEEDHLPLPSLLQQFPLPLPEHRQLSHYLRRVEDLVPTCQSKHIINDLFVQQKKNQEQMIAQRRAYHEGLDSRLATISREWILNYDNHTVKKQDMDTLKPNHDLNDVVINIYLHFIQNSFISQELRQQCHFFNTYLVSKLIGPELMADDRIVESMSNTIPGDFVNRIQSNYGTLHKWTRRVDLFSKKIIFFPINMPGHWSLIVVVNPCGLVKQQQQQPCILFLDSMCEKNKSVIEAIRIYLRKELQNKNNYPDCTVDINSDTLPDYQLIVPRQTNFHDCGLYMLTFIERMLISGNYCQNFHEPHKRNQLRLFPRSLIFRMRNNFYTLLTSLSAVDADRKAILQKFIQKRNSIVRDATDDDYDQIDEKLYERYKAINRQEPKTEEQKHSNLLTFYLKPDFNFFEMGYK